jgi:hypothetical protein
METSPEILRSINSASKMGQRQHCPGSAHAEKGLPNIETDWSIEGTLLHHHDACPEESRAKLDVDQRAVLDRNKGLREKFLEATLTRLGIPSEAEYRKIVEREFLLLDDDGEPVRSHGELVCGHPDIIYWYPTYRVAIIFDAKFGRKEVTRAWLNLQLRIYAVQFNDMMDPETIIGAITQPWAKSPNDLHSVEYSKKDMAGFKQEIMDIIRATEPLDAPRHPSIEACFYCKACAHCPVAVTAAMELAEVKVQEVTIEQLESLGPQIELAKKVCEQWLKRMKAIAKDFPEKLQRYELAPAKERRKIENLALTYQLLSRAAIIPADEAGLHKFFEFCKVSLGEIEAHHMMATQCTSMSAEQTIAQILGPLITKTQDERSLQKKPVSYHAPAKIQ